MGEGPIARRGRVAEPEEPVLARIERAHREISSFIDHQFGADEDLSQTRAFLEAFPALLRRHFAEEEEPEGLFDALRERSPNVETRLKFLERDHREILQAVEALERELREMDELEEAQDREQRVGRLRERTGTLLQMLRRHEQDESELTADVYYTEEGGSG